MDNSAAPNAPFRPRTIGTLQAVADYLQTFEDDLVQARLLLDEDPSDDTFALFRAAAERFNAEVTAHVVTIAVVTGRRLPSLFAAFAPHDAMPPPVPEQLVWFRTRYPARFIRGVARYGSFDVQDWQRRGFRSFDELAPSA